MGNIRCDNIRYLHRSFHYVFKFSPHNLQRMYHRFQQFVFFTIVWKQFRSLRNTYSYVFNISSDQDILTWFYLSRSSPSSRHTGLLASCGCVTLVSTCLRLQNCFMGFRKLPASIWALKVQCFPLNPRFSLAVLSCLTYLCFRRYRGCFTVFKLVFSLESCLTMP